MRDGNYYFTLGLTTWGLAPPATVHQPQVPKSHQSSTRPWPEDPPFPGPNTKLPVSTRESAFRLHFSYNNTNIQIIYTLLSLTRSLSSPSTSTNYHYIPRRYPSAPPVHRYTSILPESRLPPPRSPQPRPPLSTTTSPSRALDRDKSRLLHHPSSFAPSRPACDVSPRPRSSILRTRGRPAPRARAATRHHDGTQGHLERCQPDHLRDASLHCLHPPLQRRALPRRP